MDYALLLSTFEREAGPHAATRMSQQQRLYACLRDAILSGRIAEGTRLAASRTLADELGIARNSVLYAYERLASEGFVTGTRQGTVVARMGLRGSQVAAAASAGATAALSRRVAQAERATSGLDESLPFMPGVPAVDAFPLAQWRRCVERAWRSAGPAQLGYQSAEGDAVLRDAIAGYLRASRGVRCDAAQVIVTDGTQGALDLCARALADAGDVAWIENPGYHGARNAFLAADLRVEPIGVDAQGLAPHPDDWRDRPPKLVYITPSHQYPLGAVMSLERRLALVAQARAAGAWIVEDDYDSEFRHHGTPHAAVQGLADDAPVIYLGTFSKVMFPALRLGFMVVPPALAQPLRDAAGALMLQGRAVEQRALADFIDAGHFTRHLRRMRRVYAERRDALHDALARRLNTRLTVSGGAGGMHLSARLDVPVADTELSRVAQAHGLILRPLSSFCLPGTAAGYNGLVLGYGGVPAERMDGLARRIGEMIDCVLAAR
ncbi:MULTISPECIES: PLP-dependent aminotransferase family protein [unclassified Burkholderia]|uniref:MocR-like pyridoxine biosynthesis transcription factor PdxR n=1 Tax=unclassified Burkholderia TaxID=2613784 RepID=UPI000F563E7E|nr:MULTISPECIES: PLP-dependent aminotransferase family protein [unclassified Burkholderia]RQR31904.1 PLP-dependent aminotransferase family protein [Burkholderia sp. Bp9131]RQR70421.1 PLP-dependent aminotransferase family protein [Burkholderia sp. Bp9015]RQR82281.1 PLP-dependent aminotransferase family protein [Burkholderia sp. Bp9011]RQR92084.1 PLP-dependent aminotransferase family protein [Burkholderia sp. Bp9010]RQS76404.1 PLP-dependent aminotransferase family protein [Burkholderia sp. Bp897